jgi:hypothetical protein
MYAKKREGKEGKGGIIYLLRGEQWCGSQPWFSEGLLPTLYPTNPATLETVLFSLQPNKSVSKSSKEYHTTLNLSLKSIFYEQHRRKLLAFSKQP